MSTVLTAGLERFAHDYAAHRSEEGRAHAGAELLSLPYLRTGPLAKAWAVRARTFDAFISKVVRPMAARRGRGLRICDLGAGNGWLSHRLAREGHACIAVDIRDDHVDGLGAAAAFEGETSFERVVASFDALPIPGAWADLSVFNASLHYATDLRRTLAEAARILGPGGRIAILDSPFYDDEAAGAAMVAEKHASAIETFGDRAETLLALPFIEYLTAARLADASDGLELRWTRTRVRYPLWYELRGIGARLKGRRPPSRFDLWMGAAL